MIDFKKSKVSELSYGKTWTLQRKGNLKRETENNAIRNKYVKTRIDKTQRNSSGRLCGDRYETINHIISKCSKSAQREFKTRHDWVGKLIHWVLCKKFKFDHANKPGTHSR